MTDLLAVLTMVMPPSLVLIACRYTNRRLERQAQNATGLRVANAGRG